MTETSSRRRVFAGMLLAAAGSTLRPATAQQPGGTPAPELLLPNLERRIRLLLDGEPRVSIEANGEYGPIRVTGTLQRQPGTPLRLVDSRGTVREATWPEVISAAQATATFEGLPAGTFQVFLVGESLPESRTRSYGSRSGLEAGGPGVTVASPFLGHSGWRADKLPEGDFVVDAIGVGPVTLPAARVTSFRQQMISGDIQELPAGQIRLELFPGKIVGIPVPELQALHIDKRLKRVRATLMDGQMYSGRVAELPAVVLKVRHDNKTLTIPLDRVVSMELPVPAGIAATADN